MSNNGHKTPKPKPIFLRMPAGLHRELKASAARNRRTLTAEVLLLIEKGMRQDAA